MQIVRLRGTLKWLIGENPTDTEFATSTSTLVNFAQLPIVLFNLVLLIWIIRWGQALPPFQWVCAAGGAGGSLGASLIATSLAKNNKRPLTYIALVSSLAFMIIHLHFLSSITGLYASPFFALHLYVPAAMYMVSRRPFAQMIVICAMTFSTLVLAHSSGTWASWSKLETCATVELWEEPVNVFNTGYFFYLAAWLFVTDQVRDASTKRLATETQNDGGTS